MVIHNKLDKSFGPVGSSAGIFVFLAGMVALVWFSWVSLILILVGAFIGFSYSTIEIDLDGKRVRFLNMLFGIMKTGLWMTIKPDMKIGIQKSNRVWRSYSGGNRTLDIPSDDYRLILFSYSGKKLMPIKKIGSLNAAKEELEVICKQLKIGKM
jgi:hypothetical protein